MSYKIEVLGDPSRGQVRMIVFEVADGKEWGILFINLTPQAASEMADTLYACAKSVIKPPEH